MARMFADVLRVLDLKSAFVGDRLRPRMYGFATDTSEFVVRDENGDYHFIGNYDDSTLADQLDDFIAAADTMLQDINTHVNTANIHMNEATTRGLLSGTSPIQYNSTTGAFSHLNNANTRHVTDAQISTWNGKENAIAAGTNTQYWRGDKTWQTLNVAAVGGLQTALDGKQNNLNRTIGLTGGVTGSVTDTGGNLSIATTLRALTAADIPNLDAGKITSGVFDVLRIPDLTTSKITNFNTSVRGLLSGTSPIQYDSATGVVSHVSNATTRHVADTDITNWNSKQAGNAHLTAISGLTPTIGDFLVYGNGAWVNRKLQDSDLPALAITDTFTVNSQAAMLALTAQRGDVAIRTDESKSYILRGNNPAVLGDWSELLAPGHVTSVDGRVGTVSLSDRYAAIGTSIIAGTGLSGGGNLSANRTLSVVYGNTAGTACQGNDARLSDARTPLAHTHPQTDINNFALSALTANTGNPAVASASVLTHLQNIANAVAGRSPTTHTHVVNNITDLQTTLDGKVSTTQTINGVAYGTGSITITADPNQHALNSVFHSGRLALSQLSTSETANRILKVGTANSNPVWSTLADTDIPTLAISKISGLQDALDGKFNCPSGTTSQYIRGDGSVATFPSSLPPAEHTHTISEITNFDSHNHDGRYLPLSGGTVTGNLYVRSSSLSYNLRLFNTQSTIAFGGIEPNGSYYNYLHRGAASDGQDEMYLQASNRVRLRAISSDPDDHFITQLDISRGRMDAFIYPSGQFNCNNGFSWDGQNLDDRYSFKNHNHDDKYVFRMGDTMSGPLFQGRLAGTENELAPRYGYFAIGDNDATQQVKFDYQGLSKNIITGTCGSYIRINTVDNRDNPPGPYSRPTVELQADARGGKTARITVSQAHNGYGDGEIVMTIANQGNATNTGLFMSGGGFSAGALGSSGIFSGISSSVNNGIAIGRTHNSNNPMTSSTVAVAKMRGIYAVQINKALVNSVPFTIYLSDYPAAFPFATDTSWDWRGNFFVLSAAVRFGGGDSWTMLGTPEPYADTAQCSCVVRVAGTGNNTRLLFYCFRTASGMANRVGFVGDYAASNLTIRLVYTITNNLLEINVP